MVGKSQQSTESSRYLVARLQARQSPLSVRQVSLKALADLTPHERVLLVPSQRMDDAEFAQLLDYAAQWQVVTYSPYEGDIQRGALGAVSVTDRILPWVNMQALARLNIRLKSFFLKVAAKYEP